MNNHLPSNNDASLTTWPCPAKLNLSLKIVGQRDNGYHNLQSVFQLLDYGDKLNIEVTRNGQINFTCSAPELSGTDNLVIRAAKKLREFAINQLDNQSGKQFAEKNWGAFIHLDKVLPVGGGVGGGSSNCATTLVALNQLWQLELPLKTLADIGLSLGADVPIFVMGNSAFVEGIGEILTPFELPKTWYLVVQPGCHISTAKIFSNPLLTRNSKAITIRDLNALELPFQGTNCMQDIVCDDYPEVRKALEWLKQFNSYARMTGSGSCLFAPFDNEQEMRKIASRCEWPCFEASGVNISPLHAGM
ncbi:4-(cytidine 5'-diphospho)-2-C-methyl-D-erythritol kinase [Aliikangiella coralliicola]|uniref:4-diphosphocytidyl-2-C-methyl-D-erythritol kinase n=1 Tax=Aliikangiella coralliicola TaxID=2592383 RepID=A0A545TW03_9GAMM|nr:4-(cytidine 5'-diphospho)-2-C-methyl-D-erythritol kinase [Aliikangiella coralliicola]TQV81405.1 4-(cytidine 5'-diphospho)-2-C-methyl-D-erythritol kinase [Aliikangiella coralliicola]